MTRILGAALFLILVTLPNSGCTARDFVWNTFGNSYHDGDGQSDYQRQLDFDHELDSTNALK